MRKALAQLGVLVVACVLGVVAYRLLRHDLHQSVARSLPTPAIGIIAIAAGMFALRRRPSNRLWPLLVAFGFAVLIRPWQYSDDAGLFTTGYALGQLNVALFGHVALAYPSGKLSGRAERLLVATAYTAAVALPLATLLVYDGSGLRYVLPGPGSRLLVAVDGSLARDFEKTFVVLVYGVLAACLVALIARRFARATRRERKWYAPLLLAAVLAALRAVSECAFTFVSPAAAIVDKLYWWQVAGQILLPVTLLAGLLTARLARAHVGDLVLELEHAPPNEIQGALARHLRDPSLELAFFLPETGGYVDAAGVRANVPTGSSRRSVSMIETDGEPLAAIVYDPSLDLEPELVRAAGAAARFSLENARLHAEIRAQLERVHDSRRRIVEAGDEQRRRIERDLHDGAQQRLVALALELRATQKRLGMRVEPEVERVLSTAVEELQLAVSELRDLARGVHPSILTESGLAAALESLAGRTPLRVTIAEVPPDRPPPEVEAAAYFVCCEALANAVKHAVASNVTIRAVREDSRLVVEVVDDGPGGADPGGGSGLRGLADRLDALGGCLLVDSPPGGPTRVTGELPCAW